MRLRSLFLALPLVVAACSSFDAASEEEGAQPIQGGELDGMNKTVGILRMSSNSYCTGTLVAPDVVLTAAHCLVGGSAPTTFYLGGGKRVTDYASTEAIDGMEKHVVDAFASYPGFTQASEMKCPFSPIDVGLVHLAAPVTSTAPDRIEHTVPERGEICTSVGFGSHTEGAEMFHHEKRYAEESFRDATETAFMFDAKTGNTDHGDSGGPIYCKGKIVAVNSCMSKPDYFARLDVAAPWLDALIEKWDIAAAATLVDTRKLDAGTPADSGPRDATTFDAPASDAAHLDAAALDAARLDARAD